MSTRPKHRRTFTFDGKRYDIVADNSEELAVKVAMRKRDLEEGKKRISRDMTVSAWAEEWKTVYKEPSVSDKTMATINGIINAHIVANIGTMSLKSVKSIHCQMILNKQIGKSKSLISKLRYYMADLFEKAVDNDLLLTNPARKLTMPAAEDGTHRALTLNERSLLLEVCDTHPHGTWALTMLYCGLRPGETARVLGKHIDVPGKRLYVDGTKTKAAKRWVPIPDVLLDRLAPFVAQPFKYVFVDKHGHPMSDTSRRRAWASIRKAMHVAAGGKTDYGELQRVVPPLLIDSAVTAYCLRHDYATNLQAAGVPINVAKELLGHSSIAMTANIYTHSSETAFENASDLINAHTKGDVGNPLAKSL